MARRKSKRKTTRRSSKTGVNVLTLAQTYLQTAIITQAAFRTNPYEFFTGQQTVQNWKPSPYGTGNIATGYTTGYMPLTNGTQLTLPEILGFNDASGAVVAVGGGPSMFMDSVKDNLALNGGIIKPIMQTAVLNIGFTVGKKLMRKQLGLVRKGIKVAGMKGVVSV